jgi:NADH:ubiquinone oxidoreductase subunit 5 (subunit L)/multisubunit Na+/H+ antiporter MnhA subunit
MYLIVIFLPLMSAVVAGILGRKIGSQGVTKATVTLIGLTWATAIMIYNEVVIHKGETYIKL